MNQIYDTIVDFFQADGWQVETDLDKMRLSMQFQGESGQWQCYASLETSPHQFVFYSICPISVPPDLYLTTAEFLTRANYGLVVGNFEMDFADGEIRYKTSIKFEDSQLDSALIKHLAYTNVVMMDLYLPGILAVAYGKSTPAAQIDLIENPSPSS